MARRLVRPTPELGVAAAEERVEEPRVARRAVLLGGAHVALGIGRRREVVDVDRDADARVRHLGPDGLHGRGVRAQLVVGDPDAPLASRVRPGAWMPSA